VERDLELRMLPKYNLMTLQYYASLFCYINRFLFDAKYIICKAAPSNYYLNYRLMRFYEHSIWL